MVASACSACAAASEPARPPVADVTLLSSVDWPGKLCATLFLQGCPWRCPYCYNETLQPLRGAARVDWQALMAAMRQRAGFLDGVVFTGGEPLLHDTLPDALADMKDAGFQTGLHTGGGRPDVLARALGAGSVDWVALDIKGPRTLYPHITGRAGSGDAAFACLDIIVRSGVDYEVRTTVDTRLLSDEGVADMAREIRQTGARRLVLQPCREKSSGLPAANPAAAPERLRGSAARYIEDVKLRGF